MKIEIYSENTNKLLFTLFDSVKKKKTNAFRVHHHPELELGIITSGKGSYILEDTEYTAAAGDIFLVRPNEQHCVPTIFTPELKSFNIYVTSYWLWNLGEYIDPARLALCVGNSQITHRFPGYIKFANEIIELASSPENGYENRHKLRLKVLELMISMTDGFKKPEVDTFKIKNAILHQNDIQTAIAYINKNLTESITLSDMAKSAGMSPSHFSTVFKSVAGISPYEYLLLIRIEHAVELLRSTNMTIVDVAYSCGFKSMPNFNKSFKRITNMTPSDYRALKR